MPLALTFPRGVSPCITQMPRSPRATASKLRAYIVELSTRLLFTYLQPPPTTIDPDNLAATTNSLEGGINAPIKELARRHRGLSLPHQRTVMDWWLYLHTEVPDDPVKIARDQRWGQDALSTATDLITHNTTATTNDIGAPAEYDTAIDTSYQHNLGIQKGWIK